jgi:hypothetical protein
MFVILSLTIIFYMFSSAAKKAYRHPMPWLLLGFGLWLLLGGLFLLITTTFILRIGSPTDIFSMESWELIMQVISAAIITSVAYIIKKKFIK